MSATPLTMRVAVELGFVNGCADCLAIVESTAAAAFRDKQVTRFVAVPGSKHAHEKEPTKATDQPQIAAQNESLFELSVSDTNGSDPEAVERMLQHEMSG